MKSDYCSQQTLLPATGFRLITFTINQWFNKWSDKDRYSG